MSFDLCELMEKQLIRDLQHDARSTVKSGSNRAAQLIQSDVNLHKTDKIVGCKIVYVKKTNKDVTLFFFFLMKHNFY